MKVYRCTPREYKPPFPRHFIADIHQCVEEASISLERARGVLPEDLFRELVSKKRVLVTDHENARKILGKELLGETYLLLSLEAGGPGLK
ncbi:hypothetical protein TCELL_1001 [Thermogladius calderae 1633]|uniref:Uncharacterized protein n=1 Tax=Thermogladius calderae (strain DSM 22663 / VKM B-2946 / 1633) TaxID=1184251 RepID=I3TF86_THEC1|nr:hypothetical protein [Thermogladius calderae]AFK51424.1 hypothetical protein TCELL_1001 [Thermogladius calderae 1633]